MEALARFLHPYIAYPMDYLRTVATAVFESGDVMPVGPGDASDVEAGRCCPHCRTMLTSHNLAVWNAGYSVAQRHERDDLIATDTIRERVEALDEALGCCVTCARGVLADIRSLIPTPDPSHP